MGQTAVHQLLKSPRLPTIPGVAAQVLELTSNPNNEVDLDAVAEVVCYDQALTSKILRTVNAPFYGLASRCSCIHQALVYLGINTVKTLVLGFSLIDVLQDEDGAGHGFDYRSYWTRALYTAAAAKHLAGRGDFDLSERAFVAGLMQDVGVLVMHRTFGPDYLDAVEQCGNDHLALVEHEQIVFGIDHAQAGAAIAETWNLPDGLIASIQFHHDTEAAPAEHLEFVRLGTLAGYAAQGLIEPEMSAPIESFAVRGQQWMCLNSETTEGLLRTIAERAEELAELFNVRTICAGDIDSLLSRAEEQLLAHQMQMHLKADELEQSNEALAQKALTDPLTGAGNRQHFDQQLAGQFKRAQSLGQPLGLLFLDIDDFKSINDTYGHQAGDAVLGELTQWLSESLEKTATLCRYGGEEFAIILPGADRVAATRLAEQLRRGIEQRRVDVSALNMSCRELSITLSIGVAALDNGLASVMTRAEHLVRVADKAVYAAKSAGRNCVRVFNAQSSQNRAA